MEEKKETQLSEHMGYQNILCPKSFANPIELSCQVLRAGPKAVSQLSQGEIPKTKEPLVHCEELFRKGNSNLDVTFQCLMVHYNLYATLENVINKINQVQQKMDKTISDDQKYKPSPFKNIDDILNLCSDISNKDCQAKRQIIQAIRRKLEWHNVFNDRDTTLFAWPWKSEPIKPRIDDYIEADAISEIQLGTDPSPILDEIRCLLGKAIRNTEWLTNLNETN
ncbi:uncharacterized protein LOC121467053 [Drosophila elegans]|uniref:uncharacterized protein LOC121467053 n=1 Tax=Drosophila elegans TaxID=30023 RepID=UPI001BC85319|nr:uncharacterized protein LOC121467053 [Drosophila elegans]